MAIGCWVYFIHAVFTIKLLKRFFKLVFSDVYSPASQHYEFDPLFLAWTIYSINHKKGLELPLFTRFPLKFASKRATEHGCVTLQWIIVTRVWKDSHYQSDISCPVHEYALLDVYDSISLVLLYICILVFMGGTLFYPGKMYDWIKRDWEKEIRKYTQMK